MDDIDDTDDIDLDRVGFLDYSSFLFRLSEIGVLDEFKNQDQVLLTDNITSVKSIGTAMHYNNYTPYNFGLTNKNLNWRLGSFIPVDSVNKLPLNYEQIDAFADVLDWDKISMDEIPGPLMVAHKDKINWDIFLRNGKPKEINYLMNVRDKLLDYHHVFFHPRVKKRYYNTPFILVFEELIDFKWLVKHVKMDEYVLLKFWDKFKPNDIARYQNITYRVAKEKINKINWNIASRRPLGERTIALASDYVNWQTICRKQKNLSEGFLTKFVHRLHWANVSRYQSLTHNFIRRYRKKLNMALLSEYQNLTIEIIRELEDDLDFPKLLKNKHYNKSYTIQVITNGSVYFIIEPPAIGSIPKINYISSIEADI